jgi:hypothetical protein
MLLCQACRVVLIGPACLCLRCCWLASTDHAVGVVLKVVVAFIGGFPLLIPSCVAARPLLLLLLPLLRVPPGS